jgi:hypothetical protein
MKKNKFFLIIIFFILFLLSALCHGQEVDTIMCTLVVHDTININKPSNLNTSNYLEYIIKAFDVGCFINTHKETVIEEDGWHLYGNEINGKFWHHILYLDEDKKKLKKTITVIKKIN